MQKTELKVIIHHDGPMTKRQLQGYVRDAVRGWKGGYSPTDFRRVIKEVTFKSPPKNAKVKVNGTT